MRRGLIILALLGGISSAHPLLNLNTSEKLVYEVLESSTKSRYYQNTIRPYSYYQALFMLDSPQYVKEYMNASSKPGFFLKPLNSITFNFFYTNEEYFILENAEGTLLRKGLNLYTYLDGYLSLGRRSVIYYAFRYYTNKVTNKFQIHKLYWKIKLSKFSFEVGKDSAHLGPGEYALYLSSNAEPFPMIKFQTEEPLKFLGDWNFVFIRGWLKDKRRDRDNPNILALRVTWKPFEWIELGATRTSMYGGEGRPGYKLTEYPKLILGTEENIPGSKYNTDGYGAIDISLFLPAYKIFPAIKTFKIYYQDSGADITAWWQKEDKGEFKPPFGFQFLDKGIVAGALIRTERNIFRFEYVYVSRDHYIHHYYNKDGYTYKGMSLGFPYGRNLQFFMFKHRHFFSEKTSFEYKLAFLKQPNRYANKSMKRYYLRLSGEHRFKKFILGGFLRVDYVNNYDVDPSPVQFNITDKNKTFMTIGTSISWRF